MEKSFLISINTYVHQIYIDYIDKISDALIPSTLLDPEVSISKVVLEL